MVAMTATPAKVFVLDSDRQRAGELSHRLRYLDYEPVIADYEHLEDVCTDGIAVVLGDLPNEYDAAANELRQSAIPTCRSCVFQAQEPRPQASKAVTPGHLNCRSGDRSSSACLTVRNVITATSVDTG